jgi:two-component system, NtrC family, C4-dicarboxylate transport response regulator DctD
LFAAKKAGDVMTTLLIDDDAALRAMLQQAFELENLAVEVLGDSREALSRITPGFAGVVVTDIRMPFLDGLELFRRIREIDPDIPVIVMSGHGDLPMVIDAMKRGVFDFIPKPFAADHLIASVRRAAERRTLVMENRALRTTVAEGSEHLLIGETPVMVRLRETVRQLAQADVDVLIEGETGTGKELVAQLLHRWGPRRAKPFVVFNCAALSPGLAEPELLGYAPGAAHYRFGLAGKIESSDHGTMFLDESGSLPLQVQGALLRVLEEREVQPIGAERPKAVNLRVVAATNADLSSAVERGAFRKDLYYRLNQVQLRLPPLRERMADVPLLFAHFVAEASDRLKREVPQLDRDTITYLSSYSWPGNARELRSYAQRFILGMHEADVNDEELDLSAQVASFEAGVIRRTLARTCGDVSQTQAKLGLARNTLYDKLKKYDIKPGDYRT